MPLTKDEIEKIAAKSEAAQKRGAKIGDDISEAVLRAMMKFVEDGGLQDKDAKAKMVVDAGFYIGISKGYDTLCKAIEITSEKVMPQLESKWGKEGRVTMEVLLDVTRARFFMNVIKALGEEEIE